MQTTKQGTIIRKIGDRTAVVETSRMKAHQLYSKQYKIVKKYLADDKNGTFQVGDIVVIRECRPISKRKRFEVVEKVAEKNMLGKERIEGEEVLAAERKSKVSEEELDITSDASEKTVAEAREPAEKKHEVGY